MKRIIEDQRGTILVTFALLLTALMGFVALGVEAGRWYAIRSELSKAVDAAALAGAKNISNPHIADLDAFVQVIGKENFPIGQLGTPYAGEGSILFVPSRDGSEYSVKGYVSAIPFLARLFVRDKVQTASSGVAQLKPLEIMMALDRSKSMEGAPLEALKEAAQAFLKFFEDPESQIRDKMGLITFATGAKMVCPLRNGFYAQMSSQIDGVKVPSTVDMKNWYTNAERAIDISDDPTDGFTAEGTAKTNQIMQYLVFFSDGNPTAFADSFSNSSYNSGKPFEAVVYAGLDLTTGRITGAICDNNQYQDGGYLSDPISGLSPITALSNAKVPAVQPRYMSIAPPLLSDNYNNRLIAEPGCSNNGVTKWGVFAEDTRYSPPEGHGYSLESCDIHEGDLKPTWFEMVATQKAISHADELKAKGIRIYAIGLGADNQAFLEAIASGPGFYRSANSANWREELQEIFQTIAKEIKLRLVQ
jgi:hypothetical protein